MSYVKYSFDAKSILKMIYILHRNFLNIKTILLL